MARKERLSILKEVENLIDNGKVREARKLAMRNNLRLPLEIRRKFCHKCNSLFNAENTKTRLAKGKISIACLKCGYITRIPFKKQ
jgi:RNase P subunit RPR2